jgi:radical SAM protein with 4Fe4S-binding SPASM domain
MSERDYHVINLDEQQSLLFLAGNHRGFLIDADLGERFARDGVDGLEMEEAGEWSRLEAIGLVSDVNERTLLQSGFEDGADLAINVNLTHACNLACTYCFAEGGDYGRITEPMTSESVDDIFAFIGEHVTESEAVRFEFFGGEPLVNPKIIEEICARSEKVAKRSGIRFLYRISTNLTVLPRSALERFARHSFVVSVSLDGGPSVQDKFRPTLGGHGSFERIIKNAHRVREASDDITLVARMTVASKEPTLLERVRELWSMNVFDYFQIYPAVYRESGDQISGSGCTSAPGDGRIVNFFLEGDMPDQFSEFMAAYPSLFQAENRFRGVLEYERTAEMLLEGKMALSFCSGGRVYYTHSPNGAISPCHRLVGDEAFDVDGKKDGHRDDLAAWRTSVDEHPVCSQCWARYVCGGGCKQENHLATGDTGTLNRDSCAYQLMLTEEVLRTVAQASPEYRTRPRDLDDLFISCGRPVTANERVDDPAAETLSELRYFRPLVAEIA